MNGRDFIDEDDIQRLPIWARVAFAARCGRRVQPLIRIFWPDAPPEIVQAFAQAVTLTEQSAAQAGPADGLEAAVRQVASYAAAAVGVAPFRPFPAGPGLVHHNEVVRFSAAQTAAEAAKSALAAGEGRSEDCTHAAFEACHWALHALHNLRVGGGETVFRFDLDSLKRAFANGQITENGAVAPEIFCLEKELRTYHRLLPTLLAEQGKYVVVRGDQVAGTWGTYEDALQAAYTSFGLTPFLVTRIQAEDEAGLVRRRSS
jgi:hypothetical protein